MTLVVEFEAASPELFLGPTIEAYPSLEVELERVYAIDPDHPIAFCWMRGVDAERIAAALARDGTVDVAESLERVRDRTLYRLTRSDGGDGAVVGAYRRWVEAGATLLDGRAVDGCWECRMRFPDREAFAGFHEFLSAAGVSFDLHRLADGGDDADEEFLTAPQREALVAAFEAGFFDVPRETTLEAVANDLGISDQALSERLRRGESRLIEQYVP